MGMPVSCYWSLVSLVRYGDRCDGWVGRLRKQFSKFAFVIHDPTIHREFDAVLNTSFDDLDQFTGKHLLFFALVRPESADVEGLRDRPYFKVFEAKPWQVKELASTGVIPVSPDPSLSAWAFTKALGISFDLLPCIVTTDDLLSTEIEVLRSAPDTLVRQLLELGKAETRRRKTPADEDEHRLSSREDPVRLTKSLAATLAVVLGGLHAAVEGRGHGPSGEIYRDAFMASLRELLRDLHRARLAVKGDDESLEQFEHLALTVAGVLQSLAAPSPCESRALEESLGGDLFDHETRIVLRTGLRCLHAIDAPPWRGLGGHRRLGESPDAGLAGLDYSPSLLCFAKAFEKEMNLSVVHWVRQRLGISLPEYFNQVQRGASAIYSSARVRPINFNLDCGGVWKPPSLGQAELVFSECVGCRPEIKGQSPSTEQLKLVFSDRLGGASAEPFDRETCARLMQSWQTIRSLRNRAAHDSMVTRVECDSVLSEIMRLIDTGVFQATTGLRNNLRGDPE